MNAAQLHRWVLQNIRPLGEEATRQVGELCGGDDTRDAFHMAAGRADGLHRAADLLLDLIQQMQEQERIERERQWAIEDAANAETPGWHCGHVGCEHVGPHEHASGVGVSR